MGLSSARTACAVVPVTIRTTGGSTEDKTRGVLVARGGRRDRLIRESRELDEYENPSPVLSALNYATSVLW
jgi:hypothetical protein